MAKPPVRASQRKRSPAPKKGSTAGAANALVPARTRQIARDTGRITSYLAAGGAAPGMQELIDDVDFPGFVAKLIEGTFNAIVDASIEQMKAYGELLKDVAHTVDQFAKDNLSAEQARDWLTAKYPELIDDDDANDDDKKKAVRVRRKRLTHQERRRLVAKATLMGINRIVVMSGRVEAKRRGASRRRTPR